MQIFLDIGNTFVKIARLHNGKLEGVPRVPSIDFVKNPIKYLDNYYSSDSKLYIASVAKESSNLVLFEKLAEGGFNYENIKVRKEFNGFKTLYNPVTLGVDRWLACLAAHRTYQQDVVVIDAGTAITLDIVTSNGIHLGGYIIPGIASLGQTIKLSTGLCFDNSILKTVNLIPTNTNDALVSGNWAMISGFFRKIEETIISNNLCISSDKLSWILTGGDYEKVGEHLRPPFYVNKQLVLEGALIVSGQLTERHDS